MSRPPAIDDEFENVILVVVDALRYDAFAAVSHLDEFTKLTRIRESGVTYENHFTTGCPTQFSFSSLMSSRLPLDDGGYVRGVVDRPVTITECFQNAGFRTQGFLADRGVSYFDGYDRGFDVSVQGDSPERVSDRIALDLEWLKKLYHEFGLERDDALQFIHRSLNIFFPAIIKYFREKRKEKQTVTDPSTVLKPIDFESIMRAFAREEREFRDEPDAYCRDVLDDRSESRSELFTVITERYALGDVFELVSKEGLTRRKYDNRIRLQWLWKLAAGNQLFLRPSEVGRLREVVYPILRAKTLTPGGDSITSGYLTRRACEALEAVEPPFFQFLHLYNVHEGIAYSYDQRDETIREELAAHAERLSVNYDLPRMFVCNPEYFFSLSYLDFHLGKLLGTLEETDLLEETLIVLTSDHGVPMDSTIPSQKNQLFDRAEHVVNFFDDFYHIPLVLYNPSLDGATVGDLTSSLDIAPTLLRAVGAEPPEQFRGQNLLTGADREYVFFEDVGSGLGIREVRSLRVGARDSRWKVIMEFPPSEPVENGTVREVYDLVEDPDEVENLQEMSTFPSPVRALIDCVTERAREVRSLPKRTTSG